MPILYGTKPLPYLTSSPAIVSTFWTSQRCGWPWGKHQQIWLKWPLRVSPSRNPEYREEREEWACLFHLPTNLPRSVCLPKQVSSQYPVKSIFNIQDLSPTWSCYYFFLWVSRHTDLQGPGLQGPLPVDLALMGDFNLCIDSSSSSISQLTDILKSFDLYFSTHIRGHSLYLMIFSKGWIFSLYQHLIWFWTTFLLLLTGRFQQTILVLCRKWSLPGS